MRAALTDNLDVVEGLVTERNVDVNAPDRDGDIALKTAVLLGRVDILKYLLAIPSIDINITDCMDHTPLIWAEIYGEDECVELLQQKQKLDEE